MADKEFSLELGGRKLTLQFLNWAEQANASVLARYGDTVVLAAVTMSKDDVENSYFPLTVEYREKYYASGMVGGGRFYRRESKPSTDAMLKARMIDRTLRPLFDQRIRREVQVVTNVLSYDPLNDPDIVSFIAASAALHVSDVPWNGPIGAVRVAKKDEDWVLNPSAELEEAGALTVTVAGAHGKINMIEVGAREQSEQEVLDALAFGAPYVQQLADFQETIRAELGKNKADVSPRKLSDELEKEVRERTSERLKELIFKPQHEELLKAFRDEVLAELFESHPDEVVDKGTLTDYLDTLVDGAMHEAALKENQRVDGRAFDEIRPLSATVAVLPRVHGSGMFMRGLTHVLSAATLAAPDKEELSDNMEGERKLRFMHHYNFPPFSTGETGFFRGPGRREIGHGALAEKALAPLIPHEEVFPYVVRLVSEVMSSNGSSSMASVCGSSLALMDAGVPMPRHVAGIAMGLISSPDSSQYKILTDIQGPEDHHGDMDLKVAGTRAGITAVQMDVKIDGVSLDLLTEAFSRAKKAREEIIKTLETTIAEPREGLSPYAPIIEMFRIKPTRISYLIGSGGRTIKEIMAETETEIDVEDDGRVFISGKDPEKVARAVKWAQDVTHEVEIGEVFNARVIKIADFGAFVELIPGQEALVHVSELSSGFVKDVRDVVKMGDFIEVKVIGVDDRGKISASAKAMNGKHGTGEDKKAPGRDHPRRDTHGRA